MKPFMSRNRAHIKEHISVARKYRIVLSSALELIVCDLSKILSNLSHSPEDLPH